MIACIACGVVIGVAVGFLLGSLGPDFCLALFGHDRHEAMNRFIDPHALGLGLGIANGVWIGLIAGIAIVIGEAIKSLKKP